MSHIVGKPSKIKGKWKEKKNKTILSYWYFLVSDVTSLMEDSINVIGQYLNNAKRSSVEKKKEKKCSMTKNLSRNIANYVESVLK